MKIAIIAGPACSGKTAVIRHMIPLLGGRPCVAKLDALHADEGAVFENIGAPCKVKLSLDYCPDHISFLSFAEFFEWGHASRADYLLIETAGLCGRCTPFFERVVSICVVSLNSNIYAAEKIGAILAGADIAVLTHADTATFSERQVFRSRIRKVNSSADLIEINGLTGEGVRAVADKIISAPERISFLYDRIVGVAPRGLCTFCQCEIYGDNPSKWME
jgi:Ni2+-binding GTPase involved in maturation of urease and hydrogenase